MFENIPFGSKRREMIMEFLQTSYMNRLPVNRRYCPQMKNDPDLRKLLKQGKIKLGRYPAWGKGSKIDRLNGTRLKKYGSCTTYVELVK